VARQRSGHQPREEKIAEEKRRKEKIKGSQFI
jgi:hypothetical protein